MLELGPGNHSTSDKASPLPWFQKQPATPYFISLVPLSEKPSILSLCVVGVGCIDWQSCLLCLCLKIKMTWILKPCSCWLYQPIRMNILVEIDVSPGIQWWGRWNQSLTSCGLNPHPPGSLTSPTWPWAKNPSIWGGRNSPVFVQELHILWHMYNHIGLFVFCWLGFIHSEKGF